MIGGGVIGSQLGKSWVRTLATVAGVPIGDAIGRSMDKADRACAAQTLEQASAQHAVSWSKP